MNLRGAAILFCSILQAQTVRIVDAAVGGAGALQAAVNASSPGDILRIKPGTYSKTLVTRGLRLLADPTADCHQLIATGIPAGETLAVVGLHLVGIPGSENQEADAPLRVESGSGKVFFSSASVTARAGRLTSSWVLVASAVVRVERAELHAEHATFRGIDWLDSSAVNPGYFYPGGPAISAIDARVTLSSCFVEGGSGATTARSTITCQYITGTAGNPGLVARDSLLSVDRCRIAGGNGGHGHPAICWWFSCGSNFLQNAGPSAPAADLTRGSQLVCLGNSAVTAGFGGLSACGKPTPSQGIAGTGGTIFVDPAVTVIGERGELPISPSHRVITRLLPSLEGLTARAMLNGPVRWTHRDQPGALAFFLLGTAPRVSIPHPVVLGGVDIEVYPGLAFGPWLVPGSGQLPFGFTVPNEPALNGAALYLQTIGIEAALQPAATPLRAVFVHF